MVAGRRLQERSTILVQMDTHINMNIGLMENYTILKKIAVSILAG